MIEFRHTKDSIENLIVAEQYQVFPGTNIMACILKLKNGYNVLAHSACTHDEDFNVDLGKAAARAKAVVKVWDLEAYLEHNRLSLLGKTSEGQPCTDSSYDLEPSDFC